MSATFRADTQGLGRLLKGPEVTAALHRAAAPGVAAFRATAPKDEGRFTREVRVVDRPRRDRAAVAIEFYAPYAAQLIFGGRHRRSAQAEAAVQACINAIERG